MTTSTRPKREAVSVGYNLDARLQAGIEDATCLYGKQIAVVQASILNFLRLPMQEQAAAVRAAAAFTADPSEALEPVAAQPEAAAPA